MTAAACRGYPRTHGSTSIAFMRSDHELLDAWRDGDIGAGKELVERYHNVVYRFFCNKVIGEVADLVQETFKACVQGLQRLRHADRFRSYLIGVAHNVLKAYIRRKRPTVDIEEVSMVDVSPGPDEIYVRRREQRLLLKALRRISIDRQILFELRYWEGLESPQIAEILRIPDNTARSQLSRAQHDLRAVMARLASSPAELASTIDNLDDWARRCRDELSPPHESPAVDDDDDE